VVVSISLCPTRAVAAEWVIGLSCHRFYTIHRIIYSIALVNITQSKNLSFIYVCVLLLSRRSLLLILLVT